jgi:1-acyl-sn-glycerol-3-phosphate acyltransferase
MNKISKILLENILGWQLKGDFPPFPKSVIIFAPHTSYWDGFYGKLFLMQMNINYKFLSKKEFFKFPFGFFFKAYGSIPVYRNKEFIDDVVTIINNEKSLHIVLSPEGQLAKTDHWKKGFYYIAQKANVPIVVAFLDYKRKEAGFKGIIDTSENINDVFVKINEMYSDVTAKHPKDFAFDKRYTLN